MRATLVFGVLGTATVSRVVVSGESRVVSSWGYRGDSGRFALEPGALPWSQRKLLACRGVWDGSGQDACEGADRGIRPPPSELRSACVRRNARRAYDVGAAQCDSPLKSG